MSMDYGLSIAHAPDDVTWPYGSSPAILVRIGPCINKMIHVRLAARHITVWQRRICQDVVEVEGVEQHAESLQTHLFIGHYGSELGVLNVLFYDCYSGCHQANKGTYRYSVCQSYCMLMNQSPCPMLHSTETALFHTLTILMCVMPKIAGKKRLPTTSDPTRPADGPDPCPTLRSTVRQLAGTKIDYLGWPWRAIIYSVTLCACLSEPITKIWMTRSILPAAEM